MEYNEADRIVEGFGNVSIIDNQGDFVPITRMSELMPIYMRRGGILMDSHTNRHVGNIMHWELRDKDGKDAIYLWAKIFNDYSIDDMVWKAIGNKHYTGFSFGGRSVDKDVKCTDGVCFNNIKDLEVWEWSIVPKPANKESILTKFNEIAKGDKMSTVLVPRVEDGSVIYDQVEMAVDNGMMYKSDESIETEKMDDYQSPEIQEEEKMEMEKAGSQSRGPKRTKAREYDEMDVEDVAGGYRDSKHEKPLRGTDSRHRMTDTDEDMSQAFGSRHGSWDRRAAGIASKDRNKQKVVDKAERIGKRSGDILDSDRQEVAKEDSPMTAPAEDAGNPMNKILSILESIDGRLTALEGGNEEKAELEDMPPEAEKAEAAKKVTVPEPPAQQEAKTLQKGDSISPEMLTDIAGELKKMGYEQASTPKPSVDGNFPLSDVQTVGDILQKSDTGAVDIHSQLGEKSFKDIDLMFGGL